MGVFEIIIGIVLLILGANWLTKFSVAFSLYFKVPKFVVGMTVVSFITSSPELVVSIKSVLLGHSDLALGNIFGSNIANLGLVLAIIVIISPIEIPKNFYKKDIPPFLFSIVLLFLFIYFDKKINVVEGYFLILGFLLFIFYLFRFKDHYSLDENFESKVKFNRYRFFFF